MQVKIDDVVTPLFVNTLDISNAIGQRSTSGVTLRDDAGVNHYDDGQRIDITADDGTLVYSGVLNDDGEDQPLPVSISPLLTHKVTCKDWHYLADKRRAAKSYAAGQTCGAVFRDLLSTILANEGVSSIANLLSVNQSSVETNTTGFAAVGSGSVTMTRDTTQQQQGAASLKLVCDGTASGQGAKAAVTGGNFQPGTAYTFSVYARGSGVVDLSAEREDTSAVLAFSAPVTLTGAWQRITLTTATPNPVPSAGIALRVVTNSAQAVTYYLDAFQIELGTLARPWALGQSDFIADGIVLPDVVFNYASVAACFDAITQKAGAYWWQIDQYKQLWFQPYTALQAPWSLVADSNGVVTDARNGTVKVKRAKPLYRNRQFVIGATDNTAPQTETRKGDGTTNAFTFGYPFAQVPTVKVNTVTKTVGIKGVDSGKDWYWNKGDATLTQDSGGTVLISTDTLQVVYVGQYPVVIVSEDNAQIIAQQTLEGGGTTGYVEDVIGDSTLTTRDAAFQEASALLARYAQKATTLTFQTSRPGLAPGQLLTVTIPQHALNAAQMLIESVRIFDEDGVTIWYSVTALLGPVNTSWVQFFGQLASNAQVSSDLLSVGQNSTLVVAQSFSESWGWTESLTASANACMFPSASTYPDANTYPC